MTATQIAQSKQEQAKIEATQEYALEQRRYAAEVEQEKLEARRQARRDARRTAYNNFCLSMAID